MNWWENFYNKWILRFLVKEPLKHGSYLLSHGGFHLIFGCIVFIIVIVLAQANINTSVASLHKIGIDMQHIQSAKQDTLISFTVDFKIDSDTIQNNEKFRSKVSITYAYNWQERHENSGACLNDTTKIKIYAKPFFSDFCIDSLNSNVVDYNENLKEGSISTKIVPKANIPSLIGDYRAARQTVVFYSDSLGLNAHYGDSWFLKLLGLSPVDPSYNYYIGLSGIPLPMDTKNARSSQMISFQFGDVEIRSGYYQNINKNILFQYVYPEPDVINNGYICYNTAETIQKVIDNHGIIIQAVDIDAQNKNNRKSIIASILVGTFAALLFDIIIQLVRELRNVNRRGEKSLKTKNNRTTKETAKEDEAEIVDQEDEGEGTNSEKDDLEVVDATVAAEPVEAEPVEEQVIAKNETLKRIEVVAAIIRKEDKIFATQRGYGEWKDWWEFPGGKMEAGETPEEALKREIQEELETEISVDEFLCTVDYDYPAFHLKMHCYFCSLLTDALHLNEHEAARWLMRDELGSVKWLPADKEVVDKVKKHI